MTRVHPHQNESMYYLAQNYFLREMRAGRLTIYSSLLAPENESSLFFEDDFFPEGKDSIGFEVSIFEKVFGVNYTITLPEIINAEVESEFNVKPTESLIIYQIY